MDLRGRRRRIKYAPYQERIDFAMFVLVWFDLILVNIILEILL